METFFSILLIFILLGFLFLVLKPKIEPKSKEQQQEEIREMYRQRLHIELSNIQNADERQTKKITLLKAFAKELEFNLFFDKNDVQALMKELAGY